MMTADHGEMLGDHHLWRKSYGYEGSARVPFLCRFGPLTDIEKGQAHQHAVGLQDVMPTMLDAAELSIPDSVEGRSILPILRGETDQWRDTFHGEHADCYDPKESMHFLTDGKRKYIWFPLTGKEQFFDLEADPEERNDLSDHPGRENELVAWRERLIERLARRDDGFSDGKQLIRKQFALDSYIEHGQYNHD
jgi:arylsulfatase A-like enzyme